MQNVCPSLRSLLDSLEEALQPYFVVWSYESLRLRALTDLRSWTRRMQLLATSVNLLIAICNVRVYWRHAAFGSVSFNIRDIIRTSMSKYSAQPTNRLHLINSRISSTTRKQAILWDMQLSIIGSNIFFFRAVYVMQYVVYISQH